MSKFFAILAGLMVVSSAQAQTTDFKWNAELRPRYTNNMASSFAKEHGNTAGFMQRTKLGLTVLRGDSMTGHVSLLHNNFWGDNTAAGLGTAATHDNVVQSNLVMVQEAWGWWKASDMMSLKIGRTGLEFGDGSIIAIDDWQATPNSWDGLFTQWTFDFADIHLFGAKLWDAADNASMSGTSAAVAGNDDPEVNSYGLIVHVKNTPDVLKHVFVHAIQVNADAVTGVAAAAAALANESNANITAATGVGRTHYGLTLMGDASGFDYRLTGDFMSGKIKSTASDVTLGGNMFDLELGYSFPEFMKSRVFLTYHQDTGADSMTNDKAEQYVPLFPDAHKFAGLMDVVNWGNLTYYGLGFGLNPSDDLSVGLQYLIFNRSSDKAGSTIYGNSYTAGAGTEKALGSEFDLHVTKSYGENFSIYAHYGMFMPGDVIKKTGIGTTKPADKGDTHSQLVVQGKMTF